MYITSLLTICIVWFFHSLVASSDFTDDWCREISVHTIFMTFSINKNNFNLFSFCKKKKGWRDIDGRVPRYAGRTEQLDTLFADVRRPEYNQETPALQRRNHKKKTTIKQLFTATSKFQKNLRRGVFLACLLYHEDKVLVTNEDFLPVIEIDETYPSCIYNDFHWLMKVASTWDDVKSLRHDMEKNNSSSTNHFRIKLLQAASQMQVYFPIENLIFPSCVPAQLWKFNLYSMNLLNVKLIFLLV